MDEWLTLTDALSQTMRAHAPGWTDRNDADPGITLLHILAFLAEGLRFDRGVVAGGSPAARRIVDALSAYVAPESTTAGVSGTLHEHWCGPKRPRFFSGRLLTADDFTEEQHYHREKHRRHLQTMHGSGVVEGLQVTIGSDGTTLTIEPGFAIDAAGRELCIDQTITVAVPVGTLSPAAVALYYAERLVDPLLTGAAQAMEPGEIEEGTRVAIAAPGDEGVIIGRIVSDGDAWWVDASFAPSRPR
jgi:hypothetical protein